MDASFARRLLDVLIENALRILAAGFGVNWAESSFFSVVRLLRQEEVLKEYFLERVRATFAMPAPGRLDPGTVPIELIELIAHELRWPELQELAQQRIRTFFGGDAALAIGDIAFASLRHTKTLGRIGSSTSTTSADSLRQRAQAR